MKKRINEVLELIDLVVMKGRDEERKRERREK